MRIDFPFSAVVGQDDLKLALLLVAIDPTIGGVLISGERGTAKSTAARGIAALLPPGWAGAAAPFVELPLGATEDRVIGSLDIPKILQSGASELRSGLLARAHGGVLYVDEVNLLPDHLVDLLLDSAASGWVTVERDGLSASEPARFVLVGTMNPEEGTLRPQFLDRFGLAVRVQGLHEQDARVGAVRQRLAFDADPSGVVRDQAAAEQALRDGLGAARSRLQRIAVTDAHLATVAALCLAHRLDGIRGDIAVIKTARALAAWQDSAGITEEHIRRAAELALEHRSRLRDAGMQVRPSADSGASDARPGPVEPAPRPAPPPPDPRTVTLSTDAADPALQGRRGPAAANASRAAGAVPYTQTGTLAVVESVNNAARRSARPGGNGVSLAASDLMQHERRGPGASHILLLVDASGSMASQRRLELAKGVALGLLAASRQRRDEVALMVFRGEGTTLALPFTRDTALLERALSAVPTGGRTPLARALLDAADVLRARKPAVLVLLTDGRANVSVAGGDPWEEALGACSALAGAAEGVLVIDCENGPITLGRPELLARTLGADHVGLNECDAPSLTLRIHRRLEVL